MAQVIGIGASPRGKEDIRFLTGRGNYRCRYPAAGNGCGRLRSLAARAREDQVDQREAVSILRDRYRPELHYMRGPGPKWRLADLRPVGRRPSGRPRHIRFLAANPREYASHSNIAASAIAITGAVT
jgi:hypothetical protein